MDHLAAILHNILRVIPLVCNSAGDCWFLVPIFAPFLGSIIGVIVYQLMVGWHVEGEVRDRKMRGTDENMKLNDVTSKDGTA